MRVSNRRDSTLIAVFGLVCEAALVVSATLMLIGFYIRTSGLTVLPWLVLFGIVIVLCVVGMVVAAYVEIGLVEKESDRTIFRISPQLVRTLKAENVAIDVLSGLRNMNMMSGGFTIFKGENHFVTELENTFGIERTKEVKAIVIKYARVKGP